MPAVINSSGLVQRFHEEVARSTTHELLRRTDIKTALTPNDTQRTTLIIAGVYVVVIGLLWCVLGIVLSRGVTGVAHLASYSVVLFGDCSAHVVR
jgi:hypothetical protein